METLTTLATIPAILALVNLSKTTFGLNGKWSALVAVALGVLISTTECLINTPAATPPDVYRAVATGLILGLSAAGIHDVSTPTKVDPQTFTIRHAEQ